MVLYSLNAEAHSLPGHLQDLFTLFYCLKKIHSTSNFLPQCGYGLLEATKVPRYLGWCILGVCQTVDLEIIKQRTHVWGTREDFHTVRWSAWLDSAIPFIFYRIPLLVVLFPLLQLITTRLFDIMHFDTAPMLLTFITAHLDFDCHALGAS